MINFSCSSCHEKLSVKDELAGKKAKCSCGKWLTIPAKVATPSTVDQQTLPQSPGVEGSAQLRPSQLQAIAEMEKWMGLSEPYPDAAPGNNKRDAGDDSCLTDFLAPPQADDELGRLGKYRVLTILGHGGMGVVFKAEDPKLKRSVAIKAMLPVLAACASARKRFLREAQAMAAVEHDHIVRIYQVDEEGGVPFLAMELLKGEVLDERLKRDEKLPLPEILRIGREIAKRCRQPTALASFTGTSSLPTSGWNHRETASRFWTSVWPVLFRRIRR